MSSIHCSISPVEGTQTFRTQHLLLTRLKNLNAVPGFSVRLKTIPNNLSLGFGVKAQLGSNKVGDMGARDPFPGELATKFGEKVLGNADTEHKIALPDNIRNIMGLSKRKCEPLSPGTLPLTEGESKELLRKVVGWKLVTVDGCLKLKGEWKVKSLTCGAELFQRVAKVSEAESQVLDFALEDGMNAKAEIWSRSIGGLSINDFILASKIDEINLKDLIKKDRFFWA